MMNDLPNDMKIPMTVKHKDALQKNTTVIVKNLVLSEDFVSVLLRDGILTAGMKEDIEAERTRSEKARKLVIHTLPRRSDAAFRIFLEALVESHQEHIAKQIDLVLAEEFIKVRDSEEQKRQSEHPTTIIESSSDFLWKPVLLPSKHAEENIVWYDKLFTSGPEDLDMKLNTMTPERIKIVEKMMDDKKAYALKKVNGKFGRALIINNMNYYFMNPRPGSDVDCANMKKLLNQLHFETVVHEDLKAVDMKNVLKEETNNQLHQIYSVFVLCIMAHGSENKVYGVDGDTVKSGETAVPCNYVDISDISVWFNASNCSNLAGKPKIFFIQACQGGKEMLSVTLEHLSSADGASHGGSGRGRHEEGNAVAMQVEQPDVMAERGPGQEAFVHAASQVQSRSLNIPDVADILIAFSTATGYKSWRHPDYGSWFIRCLVYVIHNNAHEDHIFDILTDVSHIISNFKIRSGAIYAVQLPQIVSTLRKKVYFMP